MCASNIFADNQLLLSLLISKMVRRRMYYGDSYGNNGMPLSYESRYNTFKRIRNVVYGTWLPIEPES